MKYQDSIKHKMDTEAAFAYVREEAEKKGEEKGLKEGLRKGEEKAKKGIVRHMIQSMSMSNEQIADLTGVSLSFVEAVRAALDQDKRA